jgi:hypothetical protein
VTIIGIAHVPAHNNLAGLDTLTDFRPIPAQRTAPDGDLDTARRLADIQHILGGPNEALAERVTAILDDTAHLSTSEALAAVDAEMTALAEWAASLLPRRSGYSPAPPCSIAWCVGCVSPDPGVVDHYSKTWTGEDRFDGARWRIQVTQRRTPEGVQSAVVDVNEATGTFGSLTAMAAALLAADALAKQINAGAR